MVWLSEKQTKLSVQALVNQIIETGRMNRNEHFRLASVVLSDQKISDEERRQINRAFDYIQTGRVRLVD